MQGSIKTTILESAFSDCGYRIRNVKLTIEAGTTSKHSIPDIREVFWEYESIETGAFRKNLIFKGGKGSRYTKITCKTRTV